MGGPRCFRRNSILNLQNLVRLEPRIPSKHWLVWEPEIKLALRLKSTSIHCVPVFRTPARTLHRQDDHLSKNVLDESCCCVDEVVYLCCICSPSLACLESNLQSNIPYNETSPLIILSYRLPVCEIRLKSSGSRLPHTCCLMSKAWQR